jgi:hypothetical protein
VPSYLHHVQAGTGLAVGPGHRRQPSTCWINKVTCLAPFSWMQIIGIAITRGIVTIVPHQTSGIGQGFYLKAVGIRLTVVLEPPRRTFLTQHRIPVRFPRSALELLFMIGRDEAQHGCVHPASVDLPLFDHPLLWRCSQLGCSRRAERKRR